MSSYSPLNHPCLVRIRPIAHGVAQNLEIICKKFQHSTRRTRILMGFMISTILLPGTNRKSHGQNSGSPTKLGKIISRLCVTVCAHCSTSVCAHCSTSCRYTDSNEHGMSTVWARYELIAQHLAHIAHVWMSRCLDLVIAQDLADIAHVTHISCSCSSNLYVTYITHITYVTDMWPWKGWYRSYLMIT